MTYAPNQHRLAPIDPERPSPPRKNSLESEISIAGKPKSPHDLDWDDGNREKYQKHGVTIAEIESVFAGTPAIGPDAAHSTAETRFLAIRRASSGRHVFLASTWRDRDGANLIRVISARYMHAKEVEHYERE